MTRSHRNEVAGTLDQRRRTDDFCNALLRLDEEGMNASGVSKRTGKAWRNGRPRHGRNDRFVPPWTNPRPSIRASHPDRSDRLRWAFDPSAIARLLGRDPGTVSREVEVESGRHQRPRTAQRPKPRKIRDSAPLPGIGALNRRLDFRIMGICTRASHDLPGHLPARLAETRHEAGAPPSPAAFANPCDLAAFDGRSLHLGITGSRNKAPSARSSSAPPVHPLPDDTRQQAIRCADKRLHKRIV